MNGSLPSPSKAVPDDSALVQALQITRESLQALHQMQEQTANLHRQFLEGRESAQRTLQVLVDQQQRLLQASLGMAAPPPPLPVERHSVSPRIPVASPVSPIPQPAPPVAPSRNGSAKGKVESILLEVISEKTGYPTEMLNLDMALDADLGIDSIKRVEILSALQERLPAAPLVKPEHLGTLHNLRQIAAFLAGEQSSADTSSAIDTTLRLPARTQC